MRISTIKRNNSIHLMYKNIMNDLRFVFECFDPRPDHEGKNTYMVSYFDKRIRRRDVVDVPCYMNILPK